ncbi:MAG: hypothetical protein GY788_12190 [bacterium]|nr:hypothetical protein [bacterium]MCP4305615.1 hypothetical protein [bacterium]
MDGSRTELFRQVVLSLLRPLARAMIAHGVTLNMATEALKRALVDEAVKNSEEPDSVSDSQVSLLTGLHRKDVKRLRQENPAPLKRPVLNACALAIGQWTTQKRFLDGAGKPRRLRRAASGRRPGFDELIRSAKIDLPPATVLEALKTHRAVTQDTDDGPITLVQEVFTGGARSEELLQSYEKNLRAHLDGATGNLLSDEGKRQFDRAGHYNRLPPAAVDELEEKARALAMEMLTKMNKLALEKQDEAEGDKTANQRFTVGAYVLGQTDKTNGASGEKKDRDK